MEPLNFFCETYYSIACNFIAWIQSLSDATLPPLLLDCCLMMTQFDFHCERENLFILDLGWSLRILWFATSFQSWTLYFLFGVGFISRRLENFIVDTINIDGEKHLMLELMPFVGQVWRLRDTEMTNRSELLTRRCILKSISFASNICDLVCSWL